MKHEIEARMIVMNKLNNIKIEHSLWHTDQQKKNEVDFRMKWLKKKNEMDEKFIACQAYMQSQWPNIEILRRIPDHLSILVNSRVQCAKNMEME